MPTIPIFNPTQVEGGSISPSTIGAATSTASLFLQEGRAVAEKIEAASAKAEAQMKAPIIATAYADGLSKISRGDFEGFGRLEQANSMAVGNPFLMKFADGARQEATQIARNFLDDQLATRRIEAEKSLQEARITSAVSAQKAGERRNLVGSMTSENARIDAANRKQETDYQKSLTIHQQKHAAWEQRKEAGVPNEPEPEPPIKPTPFERRKSSDFGLDMDDPNNPPLPQESGSEYQTDAGVATGVETPVEKAQTIGGQRVPANSRIAPPEPEKRQEFNIAGVSFTAPILKESGVKMKSVRTANGITYEVEDRNDVVGKVMVDALNKAIQLSGEAEGSDAGFTKWYVERMRDGYSIQIDSSDPNNIKAFGVNKNKPKELQKTYYTDSLTVPAVEGKTPEINRIAGAADANPIPINKEVVPMITKLKGYFETAGIKVVPPQQQEEQAIPEQDLEKVRSGLQDRVNKNPALLNQAKEFLKSKGGNPELIKTPAVAESPAAKEASKADEILKAEGIDVTEIQKKEQADKARKDFDVKNEEAKNKVKAAEKTIKDFEPKIQELRNEIKRLKDDEAPLSRIRSAALELEKLLKMIEEANKDKQIAMAFLEPKL